MSRKNAGIHIGDRAFTCVGYRAPPTPGWPNTRPVDGSAKRTCAVTLRQRAAEAMNSRQGVPFFLDANMTSRTVQELFSLKGRTALVTGGSRGLGLQMAHALGEAGARLLISARKQAELDSAAAELSAAGIEVETFAADVGDEAGVSALVEAALSRLDHVDILVNNAGASWGAVAEEHPVSAWDKVMNLNVRGLFLLTREIGSRSMIPRRSGRVINIASVAALGGNVKLFQAIGYHTSKGAVVTFTKALAAEWGRYGINVNALAPGFFPSKMANGVIEMVGAEAITSNLPLGRFGGDEDLKGPLLLLASDAGRHISGVFLPVDGGSSAVITG